MNAQRTLLEAGVRVVSSSDYPAGRLDPLEILRVAVLRRSEQGEPVQVEEALTPHEVLRSYTVDAAVACGCKDVTGSLTPGKRADFVVLNADPCCPGTDLETLRVTRTLVGGETARRCSKRIRPYGRRMENPGRPSCIPRSLREVEAMSPVGLRRAPSPHV